jgi:predicted nucleic acid-binding protein
VRASGLRERLSLSYWDGLILAAALEAGVGVVCTEDMQDGLIVEGTLRIMNPFAKA